MLVTSIDCQVKAMSPIDRPYILGLQFDNHSASRAEVESWPDNDEIWLASLQDQTIGRNKIIVGAEQNSMRIKYEFKILFGNFIKKIDKI